MIDTDFPKAKDRITLIRKEAKGLQKIATGKLLTQGSFRVAMQEYVEALCYAEFVMHNTLLPYSSLKVDYEHYLLGLCDLTGELVRRAVNQGIEGNISDVKRIRKFVSSMYDELLQFDFYGGELRKKFDGIKWDLRRLDEMVFTLKTRD